MTEADLAARRVPPIRARKPAVRIVGTVDPFLLLIHADHLPAPELEYRFMKERRFKADYAWPDYKLIVEREGGLWSKDERAQRAHAKPIKILRDMEKANLAQLCGYRIIRFTPEQLDRGDAMPMVRHFLKEGGWK